MRNTFVAILCVVLVAALSTNALASNSMIDLSQYDITEADLREVGVPESWIEEYPTYRPLSLGDIGDDVLRLKDAMYELGYVPSKSISKYFSSELDAGVRQYQADYGLKVDGVATPFIQLIVYYGLDILSDSAESWQASQRKSPIKTDPRAWIDAFNTAWRHKTPTYTFRMADIKYEVYTGLLMGLLEDMVYLFVVEMNYDGAIGIILTIPLDGKTLAVTQQCIEYLRESASVALSVELPDIAFSQLMDIVSELDSLMEAAMRAPEEMLEAISHGVELSVSYAREGEELIALLIIP